MYTKIVSYSQAEVVARVTQIKFELAPTQLVVLKLTAVDPDSGETLSGTNYIVRYHDMPSIVDFIVLRQMYDRAIRRNWNVADK